MFKNFLIFSALLLSFPFAAFSMETQTMKLTTYRRGETILGEEFVAATEEVVDYLDTLEHPTGIGAGIKYECQVKTRSIHPSFYHSNSTANNRVEGWTEVRMVYSIKDCVKLSDEK